jgi:hypothetical protein
MPGQKSNGPWSMTRRAARSAPRFFRISDVADCLEVVQLRRAGKITSEALAWVKSFGEDII